MAPGSTIGISYQDQIKSNCRMYLGRDAKIHIITALDAEHSPPWAGYLVQNNARGQVCVLSAEGNTVQEVFTKMHNESARAVQRYVKTNGFQAAEGPGKKAKSRRGKAFPNYEDYLDSSSDSDDEGNVSDASTRSTRSSIVSSQSTGPVLTPPTSTGSTTALPERFAASASSVPVMNLVTPTVPVPPPGWPNRCNMAMHGPLPPPPPPPLAARAFQPASMVPPPLSYLGSATYPVILTLKSKAYGELMVLDRCSLDYVVIVTRACEILLDRFHEFSRAPAVLPSKLQIRQMRREIESVTVNGEKYVLGGRHFDLSALPLGPAPKGLKIVLSVHDGAS
ncbi:hypothetical protein H634G_07866 [Metarhizium anisopliae BRIP 53293]|uniref:Uncharacterized protein n=1 Tax=Metarhizium anisopliae BRIP 53293 TaxID=1291518 RepID=A0A0D9NS44_METAN|nr:hypothetical protein H634G_07866 [Metarhizium anisopliae BRIP 53293]KJK93147.1 hypothetical protein H633G_03030 [Metarhizium anisopliae BRIP 53284]